MSAPVVAVLIAHAGMVAWIGAGNSPNPDETAHLVAGVANWRSGSFGLYPVNPPLVRMLAAIPLVCGCYDADWGCLEERQRNTPFASRPEWGVGARFVHDNPAQAMRLFRSARWMCIPLTVAGGYFCWRWACELFGRSAGVLAVLLWCFSPNAMAWSATICPDGAAASLGLAACYSFWRWLRRPDTFGALAAGVALGVAELTKTTWIILFAVWPVIWGLSLWSRKGRSAAMSRRDQSFQLAGILGVGILVLNLGYAFEGTFARLGDFTFASRTLAGGDSIADGGEGGNRFAVCWLGRLPVPLPSSYLTGMDLQKADFERGLPSYLCGHWSERGWWYYYIVCAALKVPLGTWALGLLAVYARLRRRQVDGEGIAGAVDDGTAGPNRRRGWLDEVALLMPPAVLVVLVSSQTGFSRHFRYVLPALPFVFVWIGGVAEAAWQRPGRIGACVVVALLWTTVSSLTVFPHSMSYFNELAGGPLNGHRHLLDSNFDWGQDVLYLKRWRDAHPYATPLRLALSVSYAEPLLGIGNGSRSLDDPEIQMRYGPAEVDDLQRSGPRPGWYAVSVSRVRSRDKRYRYFEELTPVARVGYSICVYHISEEQASSTRATLDLPEEEGRLIESMAESVSKASNNAVKTRVALFVAGLDDGSTTVDLKKLLAAEASLEWKSASPRDVRTGALEGFDVVIFPGGSARIQAAALGDDGRRAVREFVRDGGGYVGICGGAFLAMADFDAGMALVSARALTGTMEVPGEGTKSMAARGAGTVKIELTDAGRSVLGEHPGLLEVMYSGGPVLAPTARDDLPRCVSLATFRTEVWEYEPQRGTMIDTPAILAGRFGKGRVIVFSPHPEATAGLELLLARSVLATARTR